MLRREPACQTGLQPFCRRFRGFGALDHIGTGIPGLILKVRRAARQDLIGGPDGGLALVTPANEFLRQRIGHLHRGGVEREEARQRVGIKRGEFRRADPFEDQYETEIIDVQVSFRVDTNGVTIPMATAYVLVKSINGQPAMRLFKCLFDTGGTTTMANLKVLPMGARINRTKGAPMCNTIAGNYQPIGTLTCQDLRFPEFDRNLVVDEIECLVFDAPCSYDLILGMDFLHKAGIIINCETLTVEWQGKSIPMNSKFSKERLVACVDMNYISDEEDAGIFDSYASNIAESTYEGMNVDNVIKENCSHLTESQQKGLRELLLKHEKLFDGTLRTYTDKKMDIELLPEASAVYRRPYSVPQLHMEVFRKELQRLCDIGVLKRCGPSEWGLPSFIIPKKDGKVRWVSDLRELNKAIKPVNYTLPIISDECDTFAVPFPYPRLGTYPNTM